MEFHFCDPCNKSFNGIRPYRDHLASAKHIKKIQTSSAVVDAPSSSLGSSHPFSDPFIMPKGSSFWCSLCKLELNGPEQAESHMKGSKHLKLKSHQPLNSKEDIGTEISKVGLSNMELSSAEDIQDSFSDLKFSFFGVTIENVLEDVKVFGVNDPIVF